MKKKKIRKRIEKAVKSKRICRIYTEYDPEEPFRFLPLAISEGLVYMIKDGDPAAYGYSVRSLDVIEKVRIEDGGVDSVSKEEEYEGKKAPELDITDWPSVFRTLGKYGNVAIVECERLAKKNERYAIGKIEKVGRKQVTIRYYGPDAAWENKRWKIPYENVTWVTTSSRYTEVLDRYVPENDRAAGAATESDDQEEQECPSEKKEEKAAPGKE